MGVNFSKESEIALKNNNISRVMNGCACVWYWVERFVTPKLVTNIGTPQIIIM